ncbi:MAG: hypothetical protein HY343_06835 [Lentisphaerae bacterium]|nr:hypothetical protein [Lentisphaerota bacterium]
MSISTPLLVALLLAITLPWLVVGWMVFRHTASSTQPPSVRPATEGVIKPSAMKGVAGPWGTLEIEPIVVEPPSAFFSFDYDVAPSRRWIVRNATPEQTRELFSRSGLKSKAVDEVMKTAIRNGTNNDQIVTPPDTVVLDISPSVRSALYTELGKNPANLLQAKPYKFRGATAYDWFANSELPESVLKKIQPLVYQRGPMLCFSDLHLVLPEIRSPLDRIRLLRTLNRASSLSLRLRIQEGESMNSMLAYWSRNDRRSEVEPILESIRNQAGGGRLDVVYLLPAFARTRLYTYINPTRSDLNIRRDCHWTTFNFFNELPDNRYGREETLIDLALSEYEEINSPTDFGDVIMFFIPPNTAIHSCVYIADDIVFTKNGVGFGAPFIFEHLENVISAYREEVGYFTMKYCRRRDHKE